jgi:broad specificity phosphatase PhoE
MNLLLVRRGEILSNVKKIYAGRSDESLAIKGIYQAKQLAVKLRRDQVHALYTSPIPRAYETAAIIGKTIGKKPIINNAFREMELGQWEGISEDRISHDWSVEWITWNQRPAELKLPGRETLGELLHRVMKGVQLIYQDAINRNILVITHVAIIRVLHMWNSGVNLNLYRTIPVPNAKIFKIKITSYPRL